MRIISPKVSKLVIVKGLFVAERFLLGVFVIPEGHCQLSCPSGSAFADIFDHFGL